MTTTQSPPGTSASAVTIPLGAAWGAWGASHDRLRAAVAELPEEQRAAWCVFLSAQADEALVRVGAKVPRQRVSAGQSTNTGAQ